MLEYGIGRWLALSSKDVSVPQGVYDAIMKSDKSDKEKKRSLKLVDGYAYGYVLCKRWAIFVGCCEVFLAGAAIYFLIQRQFGLNAGEIMSAIFWMIVVLAIPIAGMFYSKKKYTDEVEKYIGTPEERLNAMVEWAQSVQEVLGNEKESAPKESARDKKMKTRGEPKTAEKVVRIKTKNVKYLCDSCDAEIEVGMKYCSNCGKKLDW